jgi:cell division protein FtsZ
MIHFDLPKEQSSIIKVIGVGGGGSNAVNHMYDQKIDGVDFIICNTDAQAIAQSKVPNKIQLGPHLTQGLGAGANPTIGRQATEESLDEIKRILEVNTKMAFITAGMGGGTGTGGAPIIAQICKKLGILTVGIVTTPFGYEGKKRMQQAQDGINFLKENVDTLLVISNDKLRHQFGNLKMKEAFGRADNVLATAAKCITDVINSTGQINVDFADVCTVMKDGGVAILGSASASGEDRAQTAIECALTSPLLNDSDIRGAKWILININSAEGEHEFTMDEVEIIQNHLIEAAGEDTDVILGMGYDNTLGDQLGITLIATGFTHQDPFTRKLAEQEKEEEEKLVFKLEEPVQPVVTIPLTKELSQAKVEQTQAVSTETIMEEQQETEVYEINPDLNTPISESIVFNITEEEQPVVMQLLDETETTNQPAALEITTSTVVETTESITKLPFFEISSSADQIPATNISFEYNEKVEESIEIEVEAAAKETVEETPADVQTEHFFLQSEAPAEQSTVGVQLTKPAQIYVQESAPLPTSLQHQTQPEVSAAMPTSVVSIQETTAEIKTEAEKTADTNKVDTTPNRFVFTPTTLETENQEEISFIVREDETIKNEDAERITSTIQKKFDELALPDETEDLRKRANERLAKLRNLSFNVGTGDPNSEFESVPAYMRRSMDVQVQLADVETFYSHYTVKSSNNNQIDTNSINKFLDGKKPD